MDAPSGSPCWTKSSRCPLGRYEGDWRSSARRGEGSSGVGQFWNGNDIAPKAQAQPKSDHRQRSQTVSWCMCNRS